MLQIIAATILLVFLLLCFRSLKNPGIALGLIWCLYAMEQVLQQQFALLVNYGSLLNIAVSGVAAVAGLSNLLTRRISLNNPPFCLILAVFLFVYCAFSVFWSPDPDGSKQHFMTHLPYLASFILVSPICISDTKQVEKAFNVLLYFGFLVLVGLLASSMTNRFVVLAEIGGEQIKGNPLAVASFAAYVLLATMFNIYSRRPTSFKLFLQIVIAATAMLTLARSGSRGQMVAVVIAGFIWLPITAKIAAKRSYILAIIAAAGFTIGLIYIVSNSEFAYRWNAEEVGVSTFGRLEMVSNLFSAYNKAGPGVWIFGLGSSASFPVIGFYPHIVLGEVLCEEGLIGLVLFLSFIYWTVSRGIKWVQSKGIDSDSRVYLGLLLALFTFELALSFKQASLLGVSPFFGYGVCIGWFIISLKKRKSRSNRMYRPQYFMMSPPIQR